MRSTRPAQTTPETRDGMRVLWLDPAETAVPDVLRIRLLDPYLDQLCFDDRPQPPSSN